MSHSTDKLEVMERIVENTLESLSQSRRDRIKTLRITWTTLDERSLEPVVAPNLELEFFE